MRFLFLLFLSSFCTVHARLHTNFTLLRLPRQTTVSSNGNVNGTGANVHTSGAGTIYKNPDGTIGANASSIGNATGPGSSGITSNSIGQVGAASATGNSNVASSGDNTATSGNTYGGLSTAGD